MKKEERSYLKKIKKSNGLREDEIIEEIRRLNNSQLRFKNINNKINLLFKIIKTKDKRINKLEEEITQLKSKLFNSNLR